MADKPRLRVEAHAASAAPPAAVFALLRDGATWPTWSLFTGFQLERAAPGADPLGVGAIRVFSTSVSHAREQVVELIPDRRLSYVLLSGLPMANYRADVDLTPAPGGGTAIAWRAAFDAKAPGTGWFWRLFMSRILATVARQLATAAEAQTKTALA
ncbi:SRPBCC family protein [Phenylobacterium sp.]|uniref:SRPBCC family protein n=1 Tax=Phenylobacterium sp. TaxID=1871053 RepID=UPI00120CE9D0|nr:SRPBCC family protein [Phenylobacterium sp.]THD57629.1 MAG: SRPBCC family protein [Phenylobacterium sp.]